MIMKKVNIKNNSHFKIMIINQSVAWKFELFFIEKSSLSDRMDTTNIVWLSGINMTI